MTWQPDLIIGVATNAATALIGFSLALIVLGASLRLDNWLFALLMLVYAIIGLVSVFIHFAQPLGFHPRYVLYSTTSLYAMSIVLLFIVGARFAGIPNRLITALSLLGVVMLVMLLIPLWDNRVYVDFVPASNGAQYHYKLGAAGVPGLAVLGVYQLLAALVLYRYSSTRGRGLWIAPVVLLVGMLLFLVPLFDKFPKNAIAISISALIMARIVTQYEIFNPIAQLNNQLAETNTQLRDANAVKSKLLDQLTATNEQLIEANRLKSKFLANMSHELRTPLNSIIGYTELLIGQTYGILNETQADRLERIVRNGRNLLALINDILDLSKIEAGQMDLALEALDLNAVIASVLDEIGGRAEQKHLAIVVQADDTLPHVTADAQRARQIITNLVGNAIKFTDAGSITIRARRQPARGLVEVAITDTGIGIPASHQRTIFDEFRQVDDSPTRPYEGTGLGLAISRRLVELMGGTIGVESVPGQGATFTFTLPIADRQPVLPPAPVIRSAADRPVVVVIDDSPDAVQLLRDALEQQNYTVQDARNGRDGIDLVRRVQPDLVTLDVMMPDMSGWDVLAALKHDPATAAIPVVIVSVIEQQPVGLDVAVDGHITKPVDHMQLLPVIQRLTEPHAPDLPILVVDDSPQDCHMLADMLSQHAFSVVSVTGGQAALDWLSQFSAALILLDLMMPDISGFDVLHFIRQQPRHRHTPVIVVSAKDLTRPEQEFLAQRLADLIQKQGIHPPDLVERVRSALVRPEQEV